MLRNLCQGSPQGNSTVAAFVPLTKELGVLRCLTSVIPRFGISASHGDCSPLPSNRTPIYNPGNSTFGHLVTMPEETGDWIQFAAEQQPPKRKRAELVCVFCHSKKIKCDLLVGSYVSIAQQMNANRANTESVQ